MGGTTRLVGRLAACLSLSLLVSTWLILRAAHPARDTQNHGYFWAVAASISGGATAFAVFQALSHRTLSMAVTLTLLGSFAAFLVGGLLFGPA